MIVGNMLEKGCDVIKHFSLSDDKQAAAYFLMLNTGLRRGEMFV